MDNGIELRPIASGDYEYFISRLDSWWGRDGMTLMLPRLFFTHFSATSVVACDPAPGQREPAERTAFLAGFVSQTDPHVAYIHFVGVDPQRRSQGVGRTLYEWFFVTAAALGCTRVTCVTGPGNTRSRAFHAAMGFNEREVENYDGLGESRMVFERPLT